MRLKGLDLNLLVALDILLDERSVSRAAERLHLSQPAASAALGRLRDYFEDELLVLHGKRMIPTAYAESLVPELKQILAHVDELIATSAEFDPASTERVFRLMGSDYITTILISAVVAKLHTAAPRARLEIRSPNQQNLTNFEHGEIDLIFLPEAICRPEHPAEVLFEEEFVVVGWSENPALQGQLTKAEFLSCGHVGVRLGSEGAPVVSELELERLGIQRRIEIFAPSFSVVPWLLKDTMRLAVMHERLAEFFAQLMPLRLAKLPFKLEPMREMMQFHSTRENDQGIAWLRALCHQVATQQQPNA